jgi:hypothetical protein
VFRWCSVRILARMVYSESFLPIPIGKTRDGISSKPRPLRSKSFPFLYSSIVLATNATFLIPNASLNSQQTTENMQLTSLGSWTLGPVVFVTYRTHFLSMFTKKIHSNVVMGQCFYYGRNNGQKLIPTQACKRKISKISESSS